MSEKKKAVVLVKTVQPVQFFGFNGQQVAVGMGVEFKRIPEGVEVRRVGEPAVYTIYAANIAFIKELEA